MCDRRDCMSDAWKGQLGRSEVDSQLVERTEDRRQMRPTDMKVYEGRG